MNDLSFALCLLCCATKITETTVTTKRVNQRRKIEENLRKGKSGIIWFLEIKHLPNKSCTAYLMSGSENRIVFTVFILNYLNESAHRMANLVCFLFNFVLIIRLFALCCIGYFYCVHEVFEGKIAVLFYTELAVDSSQKLFLPLLNFTNFVAIFLFYSTFFCLYFLPLTTAKHCGDTEWWKI